MKAKKTFFRVRTACHTFGVVVCAGAVLLFAAIAPAQNLYVPDFQTDNVYEFTTNGVQSTFASGFNFWVSGLAFDNTGNLFVGVESGAIAGLGQIIKITPGGMQTTFASGLQGPNVLAFNSAGNLFETDWGSGHIYEFTTNGAQSTFASGLQNPNGMAFNSAGDLFVADASGHIYEFTTNGVQSTFASGLNNPYGLTFNNAGDLFVADSGSGNIYEFTSNGVQTTFASGVNYPEYMAFNNAGVLFVGWGYNYSGGIYEFTTNGVQSTFASGLTDPEGLAFQGLTLPPAPPSIISQPQSVTVNAGQNASFGVSATSGMAYQWFLNGTNIAGANSSTLTITNTRQKDLGGYTMVITNTYGSITSGVANLFMYPYLNAPFGGLVTYWGQTNTLSVGAWGSGILSYQWYFNDVALDGATNATLPLGTIQFTNAGLYSVVVSSSLGSVTNAAYQVVVNPANVSLGLFAGVIIQGTVGYNYIIQSTTNLANTNAWVTMTNVTLTSPVQIWNDNSSDVHNPNNPQKFYQVLPGQ